MLASSEVLGPLPPEPVSLKGGHGGAGRPAFRKPESGRDGTAVCMEVRAELKDLS